MARKSNKLTPRQRQSQQIMREKAARKRRLAVWRRVRWGLGGAAALTLLGGGAWLWHSGVAARTVTAAVDGSWRLTSRAGFSLSSIYLEGRSRTAMQDVENALGIRKGDPILRFPLDEMRQRLEKIESVKQAAVERELPGTLYVRIVEREPVALWQNEGNLLPVDDNGVVMRGIETAAPLPLIVGEGAPEHVGDLMEILAAAPELAERFSAAVYVGGRRWNIRLSQGIEVRLPEDGAAEAWRQLATLQAGQKLLDRDVKVIDLRLGGRLFIEVAPQPAPDSRRAAAKET